MELHSVETQFLILADLAGKGDVLAPRLPKGVRSHADVPRTERKAILVLAICSCHSSSLSRVSIKKLFRRQGFREKTRLPNQPSFSPSHAGRQVVRVSTYH